MNDFAKQKTNSNKLSNKSKKLSQTSTKSLSTENQSPQTKKKRNFEKECQLLGSINFADQKKVTRKGKNHGRNYFEINVKGKIENQESLDSIFLREINTIYAFQDIVKKEKVWKDLETYQWVDKRYLFLCLYHTKKRLYRLYGWVEVSTKDKH